MEAVRVEIETEDDTFWRRFTLPQEDREWPWDGIGYRWFRSANVIPLEQERRRRGCRRQQQYHAEPKST